MEPFSIASLNASLSATAPLFFLLGLGLVLMLLDAFKVKGVQTWLAGAGLVASGAWALMIGSAQSNPVFSDMYEAGGIAPLVHAFLCFTGFLTLFFTQDYLTRHGKLLTEVNTLIVFSVIGMLLMANANDLIMTFIGLETMSMALYIFAALFKTDAKSNEAGLKYFLLGSFASAFLLYGIALIYGVTGFTNFGVISQSMGLLQTQFPIFLIGIGLMLVGYLFKVAAFPFQSWAPDVYQGTPTPLAGFMATASKMTAFVSLGVILVKFQLLINPKLVFVLGLISVLTMIYGNLVAARQTNLKRMLAYSSIAHSGYIILGLIAINGGFPAVFFYMAIYTLMNLGAFAVVGMVENQDSDLEISSWKGMSRRNPGLAAAMSVFLFSLAGIPPLAGFMGKYQVFMAAIGGDMIWLAVIGILTSVVGAFYYLRVIFLMYFSSEGETTPAKLSSSLPLVGAALLAVLVILLGIFPFTLLGPIEQAFASLHGVLPSGFAGF